MELKIFQFIWKIRWRLFIYFDSKVSSVVYTFVRGFGVRVYGFQRMCDGWMDESFGELQVVGWFGAQALIRIGAVRSFFRSF